MVLCLDETLNQLKNALQVYKTMDSPPSWLKPIALNIEKLHNNLTKPNTQKERILAVADILFERRLYGQAVTSLQLSYEAFLFEYYENENYGSFDETQKLRRKFYKESSLGKELEKIHRLARTRNMIAHGGMDSGIKGKPQPQNLPSQYNSYRSFLERLYKDLGA